MIRYAIADWETLIGDPGRWAADNVDFVQLRAKDRDAGELVWLARKVIGELGGRTRLLINGRVDVALAAGAAGVHLTSHPDELTPDQVQHMFALAGAAKPVVSASCHTLAEVERARDQAADLILFGPVFEKRVGKEVIATGVGLDMLRQACTAAGSVQVLAIGGVTAANAPQCIEAGAAGVAGIRLFA